MRARSLGAALALGLAAACAPDPASSIPTPDVVDDADLSEHLKPRGDERLVLANFWASW